MYYRCLFGIVYFPSSSIFDRYIMYASIWSSRDIWVYRILVCFVEEKNKKTSWKKLGLFWSTHLRTKTRQSQNCVFLKPNFSFAPLNFFILFMFFISRKWVNKSIWLIFQNSSVEIREVSTHTSTNLKIVPLGSNTSDLTYEEYIRDFYREKGSFNSDDIFKFFYVFSFLPTGETESMHGKVSYIRTGISTG